MNLAVTGTDARFDYLRALLLRSGHTLVSPERAEYIIPPPNDPAAEYARLPRYAEDNAVLTAEGALALLILNTPVSLDGAHVLITGAGRVAGALARRLLALGASVTVCARSAQARARLAAIGCMVRDFSAPCAGGFDAVVNTVPAPVLDAQALSELRPGTLCLELASAPGGFDRQEAERQGLRPLAAPGLPGKTAPKTAAEVIFRTLNEIWEGT